AIVGPSHKELANGTITAAGALFALVLTPLAGMISDESRSRFGRRRPFLAVGTLVNAIFLLWMSRMGHGTPLAIFVLAYLGVQAGSNWAGGPYAALIPDIVPRGHRGAASGWLGLMNGS